MHCDLAGVCSGCDWIKIEPIEQDQKKQQLLDLIAAPRGATTKLYAPKKWQLRDRVDLTLVEQNGAMAIGLLSLDKTHIVNWNTCPMLTPELEAAFQQFKMNLPTIKKGSVRLRVDSKKTKGIWLDFSHSDIQKLFEEKSWLLNLSKDFYVEIGQRRKKLEWIDGIPKLVKKSMHPWFETFREDSKFELNCQVSSFTQPSFFFNRVLVERVMEHANYSNCSEWVELGAGIGNFTLPLLEQGLNVTAIENDPYALESLELNLKAWSQKKSDRAKGKYKIERVDFQTQATKLETLLNSKSGLLLDPPRSGLKGVTQLLASMKEKPKTIIYVSCYPETFVHDIESLELQGYRLVVLEGVDQFAQSHHLELVARLELS